MSIIEGKPHNATLSHSNPYVIKHIFYIKHLHTYYAHSVNDIQIIVLSPAHSVALC